MEIAVSFEQLAEQLLRQHGRASGRAWRLAGS